MNEKPTLRFSFVGMLFALAISQVGIEASNFYTGDLRISEYPYFFTQLLLGTYIISSSWIGWQKSNSFGNTLIVNNVFSLSFLILLVDIFLVICYFIVVKGVEQPMLTTTRNYKLAAPEASTEAFWSFIIFAFYFLWDICTKLIRFEYVANGADRYTLSHSIDGKKLINKGWQAFVCGLFSLFVYLLAAIADGNNNMVVLIDLSLLFTFMSFRGFKHKFSKDFEVTKDQMQDHLFSSATHQTLTQELQNRGKINYSDKYYRLKRFIFQYFPPFLAVVCIGIFLVHHLYLNQ